MVAMDMTLSISDTFDPSSEADWRAAVEKALTGKAHETLEKHGPEGLVVRPLYRETDFATASDPLGHPGAPPFVRGANARRDPHLPWDIRQVFRHPDAKHECLASFTDHRIEYPDTPVMAFHLGRIDLLEKHLAADPDLVHRRFSYREIYPLELGCHEDEGLGLHGAPLDGTTLLHMAADFDEIDIARWLIANGADVNAKARIDNDGFGGHTPLFNIVVSQAWRSRRQRAGAFAKLLLDNGADPNARASLKKAIRFHSDESEHVYKNVTPLAFGKAFHARAWVSDKAMELIEAAG